MAPPQLPLLPHSLGPQALPCTTPSLTHSPGSVRLGAAPLLKARLWPRSLPPTAVPDALGSSATRDPARSSGRCPATCAGKGTRTRPHIPRWPGSPTGLRLRALALKFPFIPARLHHQPPRAPDWPDFLVVGWRPSSLQRSAQVRLSAVSYPHCCPPSPFLLMLHFTSAPHRPAPSRWVLDLRCP